MARGRIGVVAMSIMLTGDLAWVLDMLGFNWPNVDEDQLRAGASDHRRLAAQVGEAASGVADGVGAIAEKNTGRSVQMFASHSRLRYRRRSGPSRPRFTSRPRTRRT